MKCRFRGIWCAVLAACLTFLFLPGKAEDNNLKALQERLLALGYEIGEADGILGCPT